MTQQDRDERAYKTMREWDKSLTNAIRQGKPQEEIDFHRKHFIAAEAAWIETQQKESEPK